VHYRAHLQETEAQTVLFFYTGAQKDTYRRGILDTLSYPAGHILEYSYRMKNIQKGLQRNIYKPAVIVFVDMDEREEAHYMPLRAAKVVIPWIVDGQDSERIRFALRLGDFIRYKEGNRHAWHSKLLKLDDRRDLGTDQRLFVIEVPEDEDQDYRSLEDDPGMTAWEEVAVAVSKSTLLKEAVFVKLDLRDLQSTHPLKVEQMESQRIYRLRSGKVYGLNIAVFKGEHAKKGETAITLSSSNDLVGVGQPFQAVVSGLVEHFSLITCKRTVGDNLIALGVAAAEPIDNVVNTPHPFLLLRVSTPGAALSWFVVLVAIGGFLAALDPDSIKETSMFPHTYKLAAVFAKVLGALCLAAAAFLAFRKLPSGNASG
jgi:hypothetical protein